MSMKNKMSDAFAASLSFSISAPAPKSIAEEDERIFKNANVEIYNPTVENIKDFVRKYTLNEMKQYPNVTIKSITLESYDSSTEGVDGVVDRAVGEVSIGVGKIELALPFHIISGDFIPFDVIKLNSQRIPYSRENLNKIISNLLEKENGKDGHIENFNPYVEVTKPTNPATSSGFLGDVLRIRDSQSFQTNSTGNGVYVTASANIDDALEKICSIKPFTDQDEKNLRRVIEKKVFDAAIEFLEKSAEEIKNEHDATDAATKIYEKIKKMPLQDVSKFSHGDVAHIPIHCDNEVSMVKAMIINEFVGLGERKIPSFKFLITENGKFMNLESPEPIMGIKVKDDSFRLVSKSFDSLEAGDMFFGFSKEKSTPPFKIDSIEIQGKDGSFRSLSALSCYNDEVKPVMSTAIGDDTLKRYVASPFQTSSINQEYFMGTSSKPRVVPLDIYLLKDAKFTPMSVNDYVNKASRDMGVDEVGVAKAMEYGNSASSDVVATDPDTKVVKISGFLTGYIKRAEDLENLVNRVYSDGSLNKEAASDTRYEMMKNSKNYIEIRKAGGENPKYDVSVFARTSSSKIFNMEKREFKGLDHSQVREFLRVYNVPQFMAAEHMTKAKVDGYVKIKIDKDATLDILRGGDLKGKSNEVLEKVRDGFFNKENVSKVMNNLTAAAISGALSGLGVGTGSPLIALAEESEALSNAFEKLAVDNKSESMLKIATLMNLTTRLYDKFIEVGAGDAVYSTLKEDVLDKVAQSEEYICKMAYEMIELKESQLKDNISIVPHNYISRAVYHLDNLYKMSYSS